MIKRIEIQGNVINDVASFYEEINRVFMVGESWTMGQSLDAFNDLAMVAYKEPHRLNWFGTIWTIAAKH